MTLYFFQRIAEDDFVGPVIMAATGEEEAWGLLGRREHKDLTGPRDDHWRIAQDLPAIPDRPGIVCPSHSPQAVLT